MKEDHVSLVIFQAKEAISKACEGRACLPECLRAIERTALAEAASAPLREIGAKAAMRTAAATARPHGARLRAPVGGVRSACSAFAFLFRRARGRLRLIWGALCARLPGIARLVKIVIASVAITLGVTCPFLRAEVECVWMGNGYVCSGSGDTIHVIGGLPGGESGGGSVVTNMIGTCTNCVAMSPEYVRNLKVSAIADLEECSSQNYVVGYEAGNARSRASYYTNTCEVSQWRATFVSGSATVNNQLTNFLHSVGAMPGDIPVNKAAQLVQTIDFASGGGSSSNQTKARLVSYDTAAMAYNDAAQMASEVVYYCDVIYNASTNMQLRLDSLTSTINQLSDEQCTAQWDGGSGLPGDGEGGGNVVTNQASCNWCTYDQGEAIKELLRECNQWCERQVAYLRSCSNYVASIDVNIKRIFFSDHTHIPTESELGTTWQQLYLSGHSPNFHSYQPTNILQRIELLLYGISGVGTNSTDVADVTGIDPSEADTAGDDVQSALVYMSLDDSDVHRDFGTISQALKRFYNRFSSIAGTQFSGQQLTASYSVEIGESRFDVPSFQLDAEHSRIANTAQLMCRSFLVILYLLAAAYAGFRFYAVFLAFVVKYVKWAQELLSSLFSD